MKFTHRLRFLYRTALLLAGVVPAVAPRPAGAQISDGASLAPPSLPALLPGGLPLPALPPAAQQEILQRMREAATGRPPAPPGPLPAPAAPATLPAPEPAATPALSHTEAFFAERLGLALRQFGYDSFNAPPRPPGLIGALPEDYVIGRDDELVLALRGRTRATLNLRVQRDGSILTPDLPPIPAAGRTLGELRADLAARVARDMPGTETFVSIGQVRQIAVFVAGEVQRPGMQTLTALSSVLDALMQAGGPRRTGSLRAIRIDGPRGRRIVDLYAVITGEEAEADLTLTEGERILVPPLGSVVAVAGEVTRPGIYELPAGARSAPLATLLRLAGEPLRPAGNRFLVQGTDAGGRRSFAEIRPGDAVRRGDSVLVQPGADVVANRLRLSGHVTAPLTRALPRHGGSLRSLLSDPRLVRPDPYPRLAVVLRLDPQTRGRHFLPFDLSRLLRGSTDLPLAEGDEVIVLGNADIAWLASPPVQRALRGEAPAAEACPALVQLAIASRSAPARFAHARGAGFPEIGAPGCPAVFRDHPPLLGFLLDTAALLSGEVRQPGLFPLADDTGLDLLLAAAGGTTEGADLSAIELAREPTDQSGAQPLSRLLLDLRSRNFAAVRLSPRDVIRIPRGFSDREAGPVTLAGEALRPGSYDIRRGEKLSELLARAGGLTPQAYPYGAVFTRESVRLRQQEGFARTARDLETSLVQVAAGQAVAGGRGVGTDVGSAITAGRELANALRQAQAAGRMVVEADPVQLAAHPERDVLLEPGDLIVIPKRPNEVTVVGAVLNPGSLQFRSGWRAGDYTSAAGGPQRFADTSRAFVVLPNGQAAPAGLSAWQAGGPPVPPGSLVVVPQDPSPFETWGLVRDLTQVLSQITISSAALAVIAREVR
ncbi:polysaccharide biosynthesis/export protein [Roseomonas sp. BU-1]|uniref:Polysaccharide biosynthesis/export protein n=2 Tax=Falsiroseomonas selenitidurans TaxID=2716335 RepID=A0ABX1E6G7_9PROT|nr:polysaccharide biosynthesis/export protein [Falsiroseomonas selenitidurans]